jgi:hypothetical protein
MRGWFVWFEDSNVKRTAKVYLLPPGFRLTTSEIVERLIKAEMLTALAFYVVMTGSDYFG